VIRIYAAWGAGDVDAALELLSPDVVWTAIPDAPDAGVYRGHDGVRGYLEDWLRDFEDLTIEFESFDALGDRVVSVQHGSGRGRQSGVVADLRFAVLYRFEGDAVVEVSEFRTREEALAAAGG
jgi:ketosteroid isomerase-like protein